MLKEVGLPEARLFVFFWATLGSCSGGMRLLLLRSAPMHFRGCGLGEDYSIGQLTNRQINKPANEIINQSVSHSAIVIMLLAGMVGEFSRSIADIRHN